MIARVQGSMCLQHSNCGIVQHGSNPRLGSLNPCQCAHLHARDHGPVPVVCVGSKVRILAGITFWRVLDGQYTRIRVIGGGDPAYTHTHT
jgi:hypothetical protein